MSYQESPSGVSFPKPSVTFREHRGKNSSLVLALVTALVLALVTAVVLTLLTAVVLALATAVLFFFATALARASAARLPGAFRESSVAFRLNNKRI